MTLERGASGLGLSIAGGEAGGDVSISRLASGGAAKKDGRLLIGDILLQVSFLYNEYVNCEEYVTIVSKNLKQTTKFQY